MAHRFQCRCGKLQGEIAQPAPVLRAVCYCRDCQAYARALDEAALVLDANGGTEVVAMPANNLHITAGAGALACLSLSPRGILRWYAGCCRTPIANTPREPRLPYAGVMHTCLATSPEGRDAAFGPVRLRVNTGGARPPVPRPGRLQSLALMRVAPRLLWSRVSGAWRTTPFFDASGHPVVQPRVLTAQERQEASTGPAT
jgi:hypothetical protein